MRYQKIIFVCLNPPSRRTYTKMCEIVLWLLNVATCTSTAVPIDSTPHDYDTGENNALTAIAPFPQRDKVYLG